MPLAGSIMGSMLSSQFMLQGFTGPQSVNLAMALGNGIVSYIQVANIYQGQAVGVGTGAGIGTGFLQGIVGPAITPIIFASMLAKGIKGVKALNTAMAIGNALSMHIPMGIVTSTSTPVCVGTGFGKLQGLVGPSMGNVIYLFMLAAGMTGTQSLNLAMAVGDGVCNSINTFGIVTTVIAGGGFPLVPVVGVDFGKLV